MSEITTRLRADLSAAMKAKEKVRTATIRMLLSAVMVEETQGSAHEISEADFLKVVAREAKKRRESAEVYKDAGRQELAENELAEAAVLETYLPQQLDDAAVTKLVDDVIAELGVERTMQSMGQVMKAATAKAAGAVDGKRLSTAVRAALN